MSSRALKGLISPTLIAAVVFIVCILLIRPFGNYPLNDDWQYSWVTWQLAKTGHFHVDVPIAPSLVLQAYLGALFVKLFGFSHLVLRALTWSVCIALFFVIDRLLRIAKVRTPIRTAVLLTICMNPLFMNLGNSFMTEIYGAMLAFIGVLLWFRNRNESEPLSQSLSWTGALGAGMAFGASFWIRQTLMVLLPCLGLATLACAWIAGGRKRALSTLWRVLFSGGVALVWITAYFEWARATGNFTPAFQKPLGLLTTIDYENHLREFTAMGFYMTAFLFPALLAVGLRRLFSPRRAVLAFVLLSVASCGLISFYQNASGLTGPAAWMHPRFPMIGNIIFDAGVGPLTLFDTYQQIQPASFMRPMWGAGVWWGITLALLLILPLWAGAISEITGRALRSATQSLRWEIALFGVLVAPAMTLLVSQAFQREVFDRYHFPGFLCAVLSLGIVVDHLTHEVDMGRLLKRWAICLLPLAFFSVAGTHDYFRWNDARWKLAYDSVGQSQPWEVQGGHEVWNWLGLTEWKNVPEKNRYDRKRVIGMNLLPGYTIIDSIPIQGWLASTPNVLLEERN